MSDPRDSPDWLPESAVEALNGERIALEEMGLDETPAQQARRLFREASPGAALSIIQIAMYGSSERLRLDASKYISDRALGRIGEDTQTDEDQPLEKMLKAMANAAENYANGE